MGAWSATILGNDTSCEVRERFLALYDGDMNPAEIAQLVIDENKDDIEFDKSNFWIGLALASWECKVLTEDVYDLVKEIISSGEDIEFNRELDASASFLKQREQALQKFLIKISTEKPKARQKKKIPKQVLTSFAEGQCYAYQNSTGKFIGIYLTESEHYKLSGEIMFMFIDFELDHVPVVENFLNGRIAAEKLDWENSDYMIYQACLRYEKKDKDAFFAFCSKALVNVGTISSLNKDRIAGSFRWNIADLEDIEASVRALEKMRADLKEEFPTGYSLQKFIDIFGVK